MTMLEAIKANQARLTNRLKWLTWNKKTEEWEVYINSFRGIYVKKLLSTKDEGLAVKELLS